MGCRSVMVVTGSDTNARAGSRVTARLYRHYGGDPGDQLATLLATIDRVEKWMAARGDRLKIFGVDYRMPKFTDIPVVAFSDFLIAESIGWYGAGIRMDTQLADEPSSDSPCFWPGDANKKSFGEQGDIEWVYLIDIPSRELTVWEIQGDETPNSVVLRKPDDPRNNAENLLKEYRAGERLRIQDLMFKLNAFEWSINKSGKFPRRKKPTRSTVRP